MPPKKRSAPADFGDGAPRATRQRVKAAGVVLPPVNTTPPDIKRRARRGAPRAKKAPAQAHPPVNHAGDDVSGGSSHPGLGREESPARSVTEGPLPACQECLDLKAENVDLRAKLDAALEKIKVLEANQATSSATDGHESAMALKPKSPDQQSTPSSQHEPTANSQQQASPTFFGRIKHFFSPRPAAPATVPAKRPADFAIDSSSNFLPETPSRPPKRARLASASPDHPWQHQLAPVANTMQTATPMRQSEASASSHIQPNQQELVSAVHNNNNIAINTAMMPVNAKRMVKSGRIQFPQQDLRGLINVDNRIFLHEPMTPDTTAEESYGQIYDPGVPREWYKKLPMCTRELHIDQVTGKFIHVMGQNRREKIREEFERQHRVQSARDQGLLPPETEEERFIREESQRAYDALIKTYGDRLKKRDKFCAHHPNETFEHRLLRTRGQVRNGVPGFGMPVLPELRGFPVSTPEPDVATTPTPTHDEIAQEQTEQSATGGQSTYAAPEDELNEDLGEESARQKASPPIKKSKMDKKKEKKTDFSTYKCPSSDEDDSSDDDEEDITTVDTSAASVPAANTSTPRQGPVLTAEAIRWEKEKQAKRDEFNRFRADRDAERLRSGYQPSNQAESDAIYQSDLAAFNEILIARRDAKKRELEQNRFKDILYYLRPFPPLTKPSVAKAHAAPASTANPTATPAVATFNNNTSQEDSARASTPTTSTDQDDLSQQDANTSISPSTPPKKPMIKNLEEKVAAQSDILAAKRAGASQPTSTPPPAAMNGVAHEALSAQQRRKLTDEEGAWVLSVFPDFADEHNDELLAIIRHHDDSVMEIDFGDIEFEFLNFADDIQYDIWDYLNSIIADSRQPPPPPAPKHAELPVTPATSGAASSITSLPVQPTFTSSPLSTAAALQLSPMPNSANGGDWQQAQIQRKMQELDRYKPKASSSLRNVSRLSSSTVASNDGDDPILQGPPNGDVDFTPVSGPITNPPAINGTPSQSGPRSAAVDAPAPFVDAPAPFVDLNDPDVYNYIYRSPVELNPFLPTVERMLRDGAADASDAVRDFVAEWEQESGHSDHFVKAYGGQEGWGEAVRTVFGL